MSSVFISVSICIFFIFPRFVSINFNYSQLLIAVALDRLNPSMGASTCALCFPLFRSFDFIQTAPSLSEGFGYLQIFRIVYSFGRMLGTLKKKNSCEKRLFSKADKRFSSSFFHHSPALKFIPQLASQKKARFEGQHCSLDLVYIKGITSNTSAPEVLQMC